MKLPDHEMWVDAVIGTGEPKDYEECERLEARGLMRFTGNQHNPEWRWNRRKLETLTDEELNRMYSIFRSDRC